MTKVHDTGNKQETAVLIGVINRKQDAAQVQEYLDELAFLTETAGAMPVKQFVQRVEKPDPSTFIGSGKIKEIEQYIKDNKIDLVVFDDELSPAQQRNIEKEFKKKVLDRNRLILDIFAQRARTAHAKTQVELAFYQYMLPRLTGMWTHLERQRGGTGTRGGAGEKEIETDRRIVRDKITALKEQLSVIDKQMVTQRKNRGDMIRVALVGYTNVGKSTIMNMLSKSDVFAENKLFATLDTTVRKVVIENLPFLLSDTVGFIRKLPHHLVESFKSTLDEVREADILIHVVDISHPKFEDQLNVVNETLKELGANDKPTILLFNKIDAFTYDEKEEDDLTPATARNHSLEQLKKSWMSKLSDPCLFISATQKDNVDELRKLLYGMVKKLHLQRYPHNKFLY
ncbi:MAG TPA: GTPase HflX [Bacteroidia bacterium]|nr:GTPase HflX [Bacteroidia bacterium]